jgi:hypothetical protein
MQRDPVNFVGLAVCMCLMTASPRSIGRDNSPGRRVILKFKDGPDWTGGPPPSFPQAYCPWASLSTHPYRQPLQPPGSFAISFQVGREPGWAHSRTMLWLKIAGRIVLPMGVRIERARPPAHSLALARLEAPRGRITPHELTSGGHFNP